MNLVKRTKIIRDHCEGCTMLRKFNNDYLCKESQMMFFIHGTTFPHWVRRNFRMCWRKNMSTTPPSRKGHVNALVDKGA